MKKMHSKAHGVADYFTSLLLIVSPWLFNFSEDGTETWIPVILGAATIHTLLIMSLALPVYCLYPHT
jgi:hypothetical protein